MAKAGSVKTILMLRGLMELAAAEARVRLADACRKARGLLPWETST